MVGLRRAPHLGFLAFTLVVSACSADEPPSTSPSVGSQAPEASPAGSIAAAEEPPAPAGPFWGMVPIQRQGDVDVELTAVAVADDGRALAVGMNRDQGGMAVASSPDGVTWTVDHDDVSFDDAEPMGVVAFRDGFLVVGLVDTMVPSVWVGGGSDGAWDRITLPSEDDVLFGSQYRIAVLGTRAVVVGERTWFSDDGRTWQLGDATPGSTIPPPDVPTDAGCATTLASLDVIDTGLVAIGADWCTSAGEIWTSRDGERWEVRRSDEPSGGYIRNVIAIGDELLAFGTFGDRAAAWWLDETGFHSDDRFDARNATAMEGVVRADDGFLAVMDGTVWRSGDGLVWRSVLSVPEGSRVRDVTWGVHGAVAVGVRDDGRPSIWTNPTPRGALLRVQAPVADAIGGTWEKRAATPFPGVTAAAVSASGRVVAFGARADDDPSTSVVQVYDVGADRWTAHELGGVSGDWWSAARYRDTVIVALAQDFDTQLAAYDERAHRLRPVGAPMRRLWNATLLALDGALLLAGWDGAAEESGLWLLDDETNEWDRLTRPPGPIEAVAGTPTGRTVSVLIRGRLWTYDLDADRWSAGERSPVRRASAALAIDEHGTGWLLGGITSVRPNRLTMAVGSGGDWFRGPNLPTPRLSPAAVTIDGTGILVIGGWSDTGPLDAVELLRPDRPQRR